MKAGSFPSLSGADPKRHRGLKHRTAHRHALAEGGPIIHEVTTLLEQVAATIGGLDRVADGVGEGLLHHVVPVGSRLGGSVSKRATKAMDRYIALLHLLQHLWHGHVAKAGSRAGADENM